jgi:hypothetical protein
VEGDREVFPLLVQSMVLMEWMVQVAEAERVVYLMILV